jgi:molybdate transport system substrate-binding protein
MKLGPLIAAASFIVVTNAALAADIAVLSSGAVKEAYEELAPQFEKSAGHRIVTTWAGTADIKKKIAAGEVFDLVIIAAPEVDAFIKDGKFAAGSRVDLMKSGVGVAVRAGAAKPDLSMVEALKATLLAAKSIGVSTGPSGVYISGLFENMGIAGQLKDRIKQPPSGVAIGSLLAKGEVEIGFQQVSELIHYPGISYVGPLPAAVQQITVFSSGIPSAAKQTDAAKALVKFLTAPAAAPVIKKHGMEPG